MGFCRESATTLRGPQGDSRIVGKTELIAPLTSERASTRPTSVLKSEYVCPESPRGVLSGPTTSALPLEVARQFQHAQLHQRAGFRRHAAGGRRPPGNWNACPAGSAQGCDGRLVSAEELPTERYRTGPDRDVATSPYFTAETPRKPFCLP